MSPITYVYKTIHHSYTMVTTKNAARAGHKFLIYIRGHLIQCCLAFIRYNKTNSACPSGTICCLWTSVLKLFAQHQALSGYSPIGNMYLLHI